MGSSILVVWASMIVVLSGGRLRFCGGCGCGIMRKRTITHDFKQGIPDASPTHSPSQVQTRQWGSNFLCTS